MRGPSLDLKAKLLDRLASNRAAVWTPVDFLNLGPRAAIDKALQRLTKAQLIKRIDRGLYWCPTEEACQDGPSASAVVDAVARRDQARLVLDEMAAASDLGLVGMTPSEIVVQCDARLRPIRLGRQTIRFKQAAPSRLFWAGRPAMRVVQAVRWLHDQITAGEDEKSRSLLVWTLGDEVGGQLLRDDLRDGLPTLPAWMQSYVRELLEEADPALLLPLNRPKRKAAARG